MPRKSNGYTPARWPAVANEHRQDSIFQTGQIKTTGERALRAIEKARSNQDQRLYQLVVIQLNELEEKVRVMMQSAEIIQLLLENAPAGEVEPVDLRAEIDEIKERLGRLENPARLRAIK